MNCGRCDLPECMECEAVRCIIKKNENLKACDDGCHCLCAVECGKSKCKLFDDDFKVACGSYVDAMLIDEIRNLKTELVKERIQYKTLKDKQDKLITKQGLQIAEIVKQLNFKGFNIKII